MLCPACRYPLFTAACANPACPQDKPPAQQVLIAQAQAARERQAAHEQRWRIDYTKRCPQGRPHTTTSHKKG